MKKEVNTLKDSREGYIWGCGGMTGKADMLLAIL